VFAIKIKMEYTTATTDKIWRGLKEATTVTSPKNCTNVRSDVAASCLGCNGFPFLDVKPFHIGKTVSSE
jgi:hypothetical protein